MDHLEIFYEDRLISFPLPNAFWFFPYVLLSLESGQFDVPGSRWLSTGESTSVTFREKSNQQSVPAYGLPIFEIMRSSVLLSNNPRTP